LTLRPSALVFNDAIGLYLAGGIGLFRWNGVAPERYDWRPEALLGMDWTPVTVGLGLRLETGVTDREWIIKAGMLLYK
jgi:hypothetical protein